MKKLLLYIIILIILFAGMDQIRGLWKGEDGSFSKTVVNLKDKVFSWVSSAEDKSKALKASLNEKLKTANEKYGKLKAEFDTVTGKIEEKKKQLEQSLAEMEEAKKALDKLLSNPTSTTPPSSPSLPSPAPSGTTP